MVMQLKMNGATIIRVQPHSQLFRGVLAVLRVEEASRRDEKLGWLPKIGNAIQKNVFGQSAQRVAVAGKRNEKIAFGSVFAAQFIETVTLSLADQV